MFRERVADRSCRLAVAAEAIKTDCVQHDTTGEMQFLTFEAAIDHRRQIGISHGGGEARLDHVQRLDRADIIFSQWDLISRSDRPSSFAGLNLSGTG